MSEILSKKQIKLLAYIITALFLAIHVGMLLLFSVYHVTPMAWFNVFSIVFYIGMLFIIRMNWLHAFVLATFLEINAHMGAAVYFTGWDGGFQISLIGICILLFYSEYNARTMKTKYIPSLILCLIPMLVYIFSLLISRQRPAPYSLPAEVSSWLHVAWAVVVFGIVIIILQIFVLIATRSQEELSNEVFHDKLTGLPNRYYMSSVFSKLTTTGERKENWLAIADLDDFKIVNDAHGHNCGDYVLKTVAELVKDVPDGVELCRWGGEEFLMAGSCNAQEYLESLRKRVEKYAFSYKDQEIHMTLTIGYAHFVPGQTIDDWINAADQKLYEGKTSGKNCVTG